MARRFVFCAALIIITRLFCRNGVDVVTAFDVFPPSKGMDSPFATSGNFRGSSGYSQQQLSGGFRRPAGSSHSIGGFHRPVTEGLPDVGNGWKNSDDDDDDWNAAFGSDPGKRGFGSGGSSVSNAWNSNTGSGHAASSNSGFGSNKGQGSGFNSGFNSFGSNSNKKQVSGNSGKPQGGGSWNSNGNVNNNNNNGYNQNGKKTWGSISNGQSTGQGFKPQSNTGSNSWNTQAQSQTSKYDDYKGLSSGTGSSGQNSRPQSGAGSNSWNTQAQSQTSKYDDFRGSSSGTGSSGQSNGQNSRPQPNTGSNSWNTQAQSQTSKYDDFRGSSGSSSNPKKVQGTGGSNWNPNHKESPPVPDKKRPGGVVDSNQPTKKVDWDAIEKQNKEGPLKLNTSELWHTSRGARPRITRGGQASAPVEASGCFCTDFESCNPENVVDVLTAFRSGLRQLRMEVAECALTERICCALTRPLPEDDEIAEYRMREPLCGTRISMFSPSDVGENGLADYGDFPWILRIVVETDSGLDLTSCGASLVSQSVAVTTAGCALQFVPDRTRAVSGEWNLVTGRDRNYIQERHIRNVFFDPRFDAFNLTGDLALLALDHPLDTERSAGTVCVPGDADEWDPNRCVVVGWAADNEDVTRPLLRKIDLSVVTPGKCRENSLGSSIRFGDYNFVCGHMRQEEPCLLDAGSSLLCPVYGTYIYMQIGLLSEVNLCPNGMSLRATFTSLLPSTRWMTGVETLVYEGGDRTVMNRKS